MDEKTTPTVVAKSHKGTKQRSPSYPAINLETGIRRAQEFYNVERKNPAPFTVAAQHWGFKEKSSGALTTIAAMKSFGLMRDVEGGSTRRVQLTDDGLRILLDQRPNSRDREDAIKAAALRPKVHKTLWEKFGADGFSDDNVKHFLVWDLEFNENSVSEVIREYRDTISFAKLIDSDRLSIADADKNGDNDGEEHSMGSTVANPGTGKVIIQPPSKDQPNPQRQPVGTDIPVTVDCVMGVTATGTVTQDGIDKLVAYLNLIKGSFPKAN